MLTPAQFCEAAPQKGPNKSNLFQGAKAIQALSWEQAMDHDAEISKTHILPNSQASSLPANPKTPPMGSILCDTADLTY